MAIAARDARTSANTRSPTARGSISLRTATGDATTDPDTIRAWWRRAPHANIAVVYAAAGLRALDVDVAELPALDTIRRLAGAAAIDTRTVRSGGGGLHLLYRVPASAESTAAACRWPAA